MRRGWVGVKEGRKGGEAEEGVGGVVDTERRGEGGKSKKGAKLGW